jgi:hypothetical protein
MRMPARTTAAVKDDRAGSIVGQLPLDLPHQRLAFFLVGLDGLSVDQLVHLSIAVAIVVQFSAATIEQVKILVGIGPAAREVESN